MRQNKGRGHVRFHSTDISSPRLDDDDLAKLQQSSTPQLRHLSKIASDGAEELAIHTPDEQVAGHAMGVAGYVELAARHRAALG